MANLINRDTKNKLLEALDETVARMKDAIEQPDTDDLGLTKTVLKVELRSLKDTFRRTFKARKKEPEDSGDQQDYES